MCPFGHSCSCQSLPSTGVTLLQQYYELIRLPECHLQYLTVHRLDIVYSFLESILGLPSSHSLRLIPCCGLRPRWTHSTLPCRITLCYIPRLEMLSIGGVIAAFCYANNISFQDQQNFGAYNLHFHCGLVSLPPSFTTTCYQIGCGVQFKGGG